MIDLSTIKTDNYMNEIFAFLLNRLDSLGASSLDYCDALITLGTRHLDVLKANEDVLFGVFNKAFDEDKDQNLQVFLR